MKVSATLLSCLPNLETSFPALVPIAERNPLTAEDAFLAPSAIRSSSTPQILNLSTTSLRPDSATDSVTMEDVDRGSVFSVACATADEVVRSRTLEVLDNPSDLFEASLTAAEYSFNAFVALICPEICH